MNCEAFINDMDDFVDSALPRAARQKLEEHLAGCRDCRERIRSLQTLLCQSASLPRAVKPEHDLWPDVARRIRIAGNPDRVSIQKTIKDYVRTSRWPWRLAAAMVAGIVILSAVTRLATHPPVSRPAPQAAPVDRSPATPQMPAASELRRRPPILDQTLGSDAAVKRSTGVSEGPRGLESYSSACRCEATSDISDLIDKAFPTDENLTSYRAAEVASERLFKLAEESGDNFFLLKASLEILSVPSQVSDSVKNRYRRWLDQHPNDPGAIYLYAYSLYGKNTPEMIRLMQKLLTEYPDFPWPNLVLAKVYGHPNLPAANRSKYPFFDVDKLQLHLAAFMKLCPDSPEPIPMLVPIKDPEFLADTVRRMRANLSARRDTRSLLMFPTLWYLEGWRQIPGSDGGQVQQRVAEDLKRLRSLEAGRPEEFQAILRFGYRGLGDLESLRSLLATDVSYEARMESVILEVQDWETKNPSPAADARADVKISYWEKRLRMTDSWTSRIPEAPYIWLYRLRALAELKNRPPTEFIAVADKVMALLHGGESGTPSDILKVATLSCDRGVRLDQVPTLIKEWYEVMDKRQQQLVNDLNTVDFDSPLLRFMYVQQAEEVWHSLVNAYLRLQRPEKAREALGRIESGLAEARKQIAQMQARAKANSTLVTTLQSMTDPMAAREAQYAEALSRVAAADKRR